MSDIDMERLADAQHEIWAHWMKYMRTKMTPTDVTRDAIQFEVAQEDWRRWLRQMETPYEELSEAEQESDRDIVRKFVLPALSNG